VLSSNKVMTIDIPINEILSGSKIAVARGLNLLENTRPETVDSVKNLIEALSRNARQDRHVIGITGPPGVGKSTLISRIIHEYRHREKTIAVISVDPSSKRSGGALLGDRARIVYDPADPGIFIRSMAAGGHLGGLAWRTRHCLTVFEAAFDVILIETVGVGQSETEIEEVVDTVVFVVQPGSGDSLQFMKAGIMEIPHILVVNKSDRKSLAQKALNDLKSVGALGRKDDSGWTPKVVMTSALHGLGLEKLIAAAADHYSTLSAGDMAEKRRQYRISWIFLMFKERFGSFGIEVLGGEKKVLAAIGRSDVSNPFAGLDILKDALLVTVTRKFFNHEKK
jgi:LAO/AO transport system kinase